MNQKGLEQSVEVFKRKVTATGSSVHASGDAVSSFADHVPSQKMQKDIFREEMYFMACGT